MFGNWQELKITYSMKEQEAIKAALDAENIPYKVKTSSRLESTRSAIGTNQMDLDNYYEYRIFVKKKDLEQAQTLI